MDTTHCDHCNEDFLAVSEDDVHLSAAGDLGELVERVVAEIREDIDNGTVPADVEHFHELHSYVDANEYGGFTTDNDRYAHCVVNEIQTRVDRILSGTKSVV